MNDIEVSSAPDRELKAGFFFLTPVRCMNLHTSHDVLCWVYKADKNDV